MDIYKFIQIIIRRIKILILVPVIIGGIMVFLTRNQPQEFTSSASIFTAITSNSSLEDLGQSRVDYFATKSAYNNLLSILNSRSVIEETSLRLLASHLILSEPKNSVISKSSYDELQKIIPEDIKQLVQPNNAEKTYRNLVDYLNQDSENFLYGLLNFNHPHYSYKAISTIKALQKDGSDIIQFTYSSNDAAIAYQTLNILINVFLSKYSVLKMNQTSAVVEYFEKQLKKSSDELGDAEDRMLEFNKSNNIINYYEQTKHISSQQEKIEVKLQDILMEYQSAEAVLEKLEAETKLRFNINLKNTEIMDIRKSLIAVSQKLAEMEIEATDSFESSVLQDELYEMKSGLEMQLHDKLDSLYIYEYNTEGIAIETLLNDWLKTIIEFESARARLLAMQAKSKEFQELYTKYAPLGAILKRIEREIDVKEKEYLEILHHLGLAKLKQQNEEMMSNMKIMDKPQLPIDPIPTKRKVLIIVAAFFSFIVALFGFIVFELLDKTIKTATRFAKLSELEIKSVACKTTSGSDVEFEKINKRGLKQSIENIIEARQKSKDPVVIQFFSNWKEEGKTFIIEQLRSMVDKTGLKTTHVTLNEDGLFINPENQEQLGNQFTFSDYQNLAKSNSGSDVIFVEIPEFSDKVLNTQLMGTASLSFLVADANRTWAQADNHIVNHLKEIIPSNLFGILNRTIPYNMEEIIGEIPKRRTRFRKFFKNNIIKRIF